MTDRYERQGAIMRLVRERQLSTQSELAKALRESGYDVVQTTVSRDIAQLGLVKVRNRDGRLVYALPGAEDLTRLSELATALRRSLRQSTAHSSRTSPERSPARTRSSSPPGRA